MTDASEMTQKEKTLVFWASFLSLAAAGFGFVFRVLYGGAYGGDLELSAFQGQMIFGASLWPIAITMILGSLLVDKTGYKMPMYVAFVLQALSAVLTFFADSYNTLFFAALCAGLGHGIVECVINPVCSTIYHNSKTKMLTILHAAWPAGLAVGGLIMIATHAAGLEDWKYHSLWILLPTVAYLFMLIPCRFPIDERVKAGVPYKTMLRQVGFLGCFIAAFLLIYEIGKQGTLLATAAEPGMNWFYISLAAGIVVAAIFGFAVGSIGKPLFFFFCVMMIPLATAELGTDTLIKELMKPVLESFKVNPGFSIVFSATVMMVLRLLAGGVLKIFSPPALLAVSGIFSAVGLWWLSGAEGSAIFIAFTLYAIGQTFYWPCVLGFVAEQYPKGGALTLNTVSAIGLLAVGIIGSQLLGIATDKSEYRRANEELPALAEATKEEKNFLWMTHTAINQEKKGEYVGGLPADVREKTKEQLTEIKTATGRDVLKFAAWFPATLVIGFGVVAIYYFSRGGYKPVEILDQDEGGSGDDS